MGLALATLFVFLGLVQENNVICLLPERNGFREEKKVCLQNKLLRASCPNPLEEGSARKVAHFGSWPSMER